MNIIHTQNAVTIKTKLYSINFKQKKYAFTDLFNDHIYD